MPAYIGGRFQTAGTKSLTVIRRTSIATYRELTVLLLFMITRQAESHA